MSTYLTAIALIAGKHEHVMQIHRLILAAEAIVPSETFNWTFITTHTDTCALIRCQGGLTDYPPQVQNVLRLDPRLRELDICCLLDTQMEGYAPKTSCWHRGMQERAPYRGGQAMTAFDAWCRQHGVIAESRRNFAHEMLCGHPPGKSPTEASG